MTAFTEITPSAFRSAIGQAIGTGVASGLLTLVDPAKLRLATRVCVYVGSAVIPASLVWIGTGASDSPKHGMLLRGSIAAALGAVSAGGTKISFVVDGKIHRAFLRRGLENPRPVMAIGTAVLTAAMVLVEPPRAPDEDPASTEVPESDTRP